MSLTKDSLLDGKIQILQPESGLRATTDTVFLAAACPAGTDEAKNSEGPRILDLGCGTGAAGLCVLARVPQASLTGIDIQMDLIDLAGRNAALNGMKARARFVCADIRTFEGGPFDHVICNPPYLTAGAHTASPHRSKALASGESSADDADLKDWIDTAFRSLNPHGTLTMIHRADAIDRIMQGLGKRFGAIEILPLWPKAGKPASRIIVRARPNRRTAASLHPGILMHQSDGSYTIDADRILKGACVL